MIEIKCTKRQKAIIIASLLNPDGCLWPREKRTCWTDPKKCCKRCFETKIKWIHEKKEVNE